MTVVGTTSGGGADFWYFSNTSLSPSDPKWDRPLGGGCVRVGGIERCRGDDEGSRRSLNLDSTPKRLERAGHRTGGRRSVGRRLLRAYQ